MFPNKSLNFNYFLSLLMTIIISQQIMLSAAQQNSLNPMNAIEKSQEQITRLWHKNHNISDALDNKYSDAISLRASNELMRASSVVCYECNSYLDPDCMSHPEKFAKNCTDSFEGSAYIGCRKIDQWVDYNGGEELKAHHRVIRQCAAHGDLSKPCYYRAGYGGRVNACFCENNLCNSGLSLEVINRDILFVLIFSIFLINRFSV